MKSWAIWTARTVLVATGFVAVGGGLAGVAFASTVNQDNTSVASVNQVLTGGRLPPPPSGPTLPAPKPAPKPKHHRKPPKHHRHHGCTAENGAETQPEARWAMSVARWVQNVRTGRMIRLRRVAFLLPSALSRSLASSQSPYSA